MRHSYFVLLAAIAAPTAFATDITVVPGQSIQAAIATAQPGDRVLVQPGTYFEALDLMSKGIEIIGVGGPSVTAVDATGLNTSVVRIDNTPFGPPVVIDGLTLTGGSGSPSPSGAAGGGGVRIHQSAIQILISHCVITNNHVGTRIGGGALVESAPTRFLECMIDGNSAFRGGGTHGDVELWSCTVSNNLAQENGGGSYAPGFVRLTTFENNAAQNGGGVYLGSFFHFFKNGASYPTTQATFIGNTATNEGGGAYLYAWNSPFPPHALSLVLHQCVFVQNSAAVGGGLRLTVEITGGIGADWPVTSCVFSGNTAATGDGAYITTQGAVASEVQLYFCTFDGNGVGGQVNGIHSSVLRNLPNFFANLVGPPPAIDFSNVQGGAPGAGNIDADPLWVAPAALDYRLSLGSPCIDATDWGSIISSSPMAFDVDSTPRVQHGVADMGANEFDSDCDFDGVFDFVEIAQGSQTDCDFNGIADDCQPLVDCNANGVQDACDIKFGFEADCNFNGVPDSCEGGSQDCNGNGIPDLCDLASGFETDCNANGVLDSCESLSDCDGDGIFDVCEIAAHTQLDCNANGVPDSCEIASGAAADVDGNGIPDSCHGILAVPSQFSTLQAAIDAALPADTVLVADGVYSGPGNVALDFKGKSILLASANGPDHCVLDGLGSGPIVSIDAAAEKPTLRGFTLRGGNATNGGAIVISNGAEPTIDACVFVDNTALKGGAVFVQSSKPKFRACRFIDNLATQEGGAFFATGASTLASVEHSSFVGNSVSQVGGAGGAVSANSMAWIHLSASIFWSNTATKGAALAVTGTYQSVLLVYFSDVQGGKPGVFVGPNSALTWDASNINADPQTVDLGGRDLHLKATSPCRDTGVVVWAHDAEGDATVGAPDMGADEFAAHAYTTGIASPGQTIVVTTIGTPGTAPVLELYGLTRLLPPVPTPYGALHAGPPYLGGAPVVLPTVPADGVIAYSVLVPVGVPVGLTVYRQVFLGPPESKLTNLDVITIVP